MRRASRVLFATAWLAVACAGCGSDGAAPTVREAEETRNDTMEFEVQKTEEEWREQLTETQYRVTREQGTERAFSGEYWDETADGTYACVCCGQPLFGSDAKYKSGTGWPSFWQPIREKAVAERDDRGLFSRRTEVICSRCGAHLGHLFEDGPEPTGLRYCVNSAALDLQKAGEE